MFKHLHRETKAMFITMILVTPIASQALVDMSITSFTDNSAEVITTNYFHWQFSAKTTTTTASVFPLSGINAVRKL